MEGPADKIDRGPICPKAKKTLTNRAGARIMIIISLQNALRGNRRAFPSCRELPGGARQYGRRVISPFSSRLNAARQVGRTGSWPLPDRQAHSPQRADAENERAAKLPSKSGTTEHTPSSLSRDGGFFYPQKPNREREQTTGKNKSRSWTHRCAMGSSLPDAA